MSARHPRRRLAQAAAVACVGAVAVSCAAAAVTGPAGAAPAAAPMVGQAIKADRSPPLRSIAPRAAPGSATAPPVRHRQSVASPPAASPTAGRALDPVQQSRAPAAAAPAALTSWDGLTNRDGAVPPDTEGDVGPHDYVQWVNTSFAIWAKNGTLRYGPAEGNTLWTGFGGVCETNNQGDPVVVYDRTADRWVFTQFGFAGTGSSGPYYMCMAVSTTGDPTGSYYRYAFQVNTGSGDFPDYPKVGVWPDGYYVTTNNFSGNSFAGAGVYAFDRTKMLAGDTSASFVGYQLAGQYEGLLPASVTGPTPPPTGAAGYFGAVDTSSTTSTANTFQIWRLHPDFATPASSTLTGPVDLAVAPYTWWFCGSPTPTGCIAQPGTHRTLDPLADRLMFRLQYRNFGDHETLIASHTVNVGSDRAGVRWYEIRSPGGTPTVAQQGTFAPADSISRWMGSAAMDANGDIALGYSASAASTTYPSVLYTGRLAGDPPGTMTLGEGALATGAGSQTGISRWGDYSAMSIDPSDDLTFWYTQEYYSATSSSGWSTRIGSFRLAAGPHVTLASPADASLTNNATPTFSGTGGSAAGDNSTVTVNVYSGTSVGGTLVQTRTATVSSGTWSVAASPALPDGTYTARAQQSNNAGDTGYSGANTFTVDTTPPAVTVTSPAAGPSSNTTPAFAGAAGTAAGDLPGITAVVYAGTGTGGAVVQTLHATATGGSWSTTASSALAPGSYTVQAQQSDAAGNVGTSSPRTFTVTDTPPTASFTFTPAAPLSGQAVAFDGGASSDPDGSIVAWSWDFGDGSSAATTRQTTHTYAAAGAYTVSLTVTDDAGGSGSAWQTVNVSAPAPPAPTPGAPGAGAPTQVVPAPLAPLAPIAPVTPAAPHATGAAAPLIAYLQVPSQRLGSVLAHGVRVRLGANAPVTATLGVSVGGTAARRLAGKSRSRRKPPNAAAIGRIRVAVSRPGTMPALVTLSPRIARRLRGVKSIALSFNLRVIDRSGRTTSLLRHVTVRL